MEVKDKIVSSQLLGVGWEKRTVRKKAKTLKERYKPEDDKIYIGHGCRKHLLYYLVTSEQDYSYHHLSNLK